MRWLYLIGLALLAANLHAAPLRSDFPWQTWGPEVFERAARENKFVLLSLQAWWCEPCHRMNSITYDDPQVREVIASKFIPVYIDQDSRPDISQRYERWGWPATIIFDPDGTEIVKLRGFYSPKFFLPVLQATIDDPSPVDYRLLGGPERERSLATALSDERRASLENFFNVQSYDTRHGGWGTRGKLIDGPTLDYAFDQARYGDDKMRKRLRETLDGMLTLIDPETGAMAKASRVDWSRPFREYTMFAQEGGLRGLSLGYAMFGDIRYRRGADRIFVFMRDTMTAPDGGFYASMGAEEFDPGIDKRRYSRENGKGIAGVLAYYDATGNTDALNLVQSNARWVLANRALPGGGFRHDAVDRGGPYLADTLEMGRALLHLHRSTGAREWLTAATAAGDFLIATFTDPTTGGFLTAAVPAETFMHKAIKQKDDNVLATRFLNHLYAYTGEAKFRQAAEAGMGYLSSDAVLEAWWYLPGVLQAEHELTREPIHVTIVGAKADPRSASLYKAALAYAAVHKRADWWDRAEGPLPNDTVAYPELAKPAAFACSGNVCSLPVTNPREVAAALDRLLE
jgi:uncharacterized protein YyaL (SSP411 family)